ncbi:MAG: M48 family metalloprotease [Selenomonadaceae bacterium]|nr:M48 family metalloprotease [Selenomonadaceae bacterium]
MTLKKLAKKICATLAAGVFGLTITFSALPAPNVSAFGFSEALGIGAAVLSGSAQMEQAKKQIDYFNNTEEGRQELYQYFREQQGVNEDPTLNSRLSAIMANLSNAVAQIDPSINNKPYLYFIASDESLNAACAMGHVMMVNTGAFMHLASDDEIAAIVGHEMGHGQKDHGAKGIKKQINKTMLAQIGATAAGGGTIANVVASIALTNSIAHGDRKQETEADNLAWEYILRTNYNPGACAAVMQRLAELYGEKSNSTFLNPSDHPDTAKRRDNYANKLYEYSGKHASANSGVVTVNGKTFMTVAATSSMSSAERAFFILGNIAAAYHNKHNFSEAYVQNGTVMLGAQPIIAPEEGDEDAYTLAERLNSIK